MCFVDFRFVSWFSYHLSNFQFKWSWEDWEEVLRLDPEHPKPKFVKETLLRCLRLSYHQRVADGVPESFQGLVPDQPEPVVKYKMPSGDQVWSLTHFFGLPYDCELLLSFSLKDTEMSLGMLAKSHLTTHCQMCPLP